ncbi:MAG: hypothetical protein ACODAG_09350 [Myxococcota bacterium]
MRIRVTPDEFAWIIESLPEKMEKAIVRGLRSAAHRMWGFVVEEIDTAKPYPAVDRGELRSSVGVTSVPDGADVHVDAPHAPFLEWGTRPHWPPFEPIYHWVQRKGLAADPDEAEDVARAVQLKIAMFGTEPRGYMAKAYQRTLDIVMEEIEHELERMRTR